MTEQTINNVIVAGVAFIGTVLGAAIAVIGTIICAFPTKIRASYQELEQDLIGMSIDAVKEIHYDFYKDAAEEKRFASYCKSRDRISRRVDMLDQECEEALENSVKEYQDFIDKGIL